VAGAAAAAAGAGAAGAGAAGGGAAGGAGGGAGGAGGGGGGGGGGAGGAAAGRCWAMKRPSTTASATTRQSRAPDRMASSFPGITWVITSGSQLVSTTATTGSPSLLAS